MSGPWKGDRRHFLMVMLAGIATPLVAACSSSPPSVATTSSPSSQATSVPAESPVGQVTPRTTSVPTVSPVAQPQAQSAPPVEIAYWHFWADRWGKIQEAVVNDYNKTAGQQDHIHVSVLIVPWGDLNTKLLAAISGGTPPDCAMIGRNLVATWAVKGAILSNDDLVRASKTVKPSDWYPVAWTEVVWK